MVKVGGWGRVKEKGVGVEEVNWSGEGWKERQKGGRKKSRYIFLGKMWTFWGFNVTMAA